MGDERDELPKNKSARRREFHRRQTAARAVKRDSNRARRVEHHDVHHANDRATVPAQLKTQARMFGIEPLVLMGDQDLADLPDGMVEYSRGLFDLSNPTTTDDLPALIQLVVALILRWADQQPEPKQSVSSMTARCGLRLEVDDDLSADGTTYRWELEPSGPFSRVAMVIANRVALLEV